MPVLLPKIFKNHNEIERHIELKSKLYTEFCTVMNSLLIIMINETLINKSTIIKRSHSYSRQYMPFLFRSIIPRLCEARKC